MAQDDNTQRWAMYAIISFNVTVILCMIVYSFARGGPAGLYFMDFFVSLILAGIVAGGVLWASAKLKL